MRLIDSKWKWCILQELRHGRLGVSEVEKVFGEGTRRVLEIEVKELFDAAEGQGQVVLGVEDIEVHSGRYFRATKVVNVCTRCKRVEYGVQELMERVAGQRTNCQNKMQNLLYFLECNPILFSN